MAIDYSRSYDYKSISRHAFMLRIRSPTQTQHQRQKSKGVKEKEKHRTRLTASAHLGSSTAQAQKHTTPQRKSEIDVLCEENRGSGSGPLAWRKKGQMGL